MSKTLCVTVDTHNKVKKQRDALLEACKKALPLIAGERIANDAFPPTDYLGKCLAESMEKSEKELQAAIAPVEGGSDD